MFKNIFIEESSLLFHRCTKERISGRVQGSVQGVVESRDGVDMAFSLDGCDDCDKETIVRSHLMKHSEVKHERFFLVI